MKQIRLLRTLALGMAMAAGAGALPAFAQTGFVAPLNSDADRLAQQMRVLAASPRDVAALLEAGMLSARLGDTSAALAFFARAEAVEPGNPRILVGRAAALVRMERPGEALRLFQTAEARGVSVREFASDRGFAYDLLGQPALAQADYRLWLQTSRDDESVRRYALSLGITGEPEAAMRQLDALLRRSDRAAWRARAFILAMNGDSAGAERIAESMMPGNMGAALVPFFRRLPGLSPADRAFAVHFGELSATAARLADARFAPVLPRYVPSARPVQVAQAQPARAAAASNAGRNRRNQRERDRDGTLAPPVRRAVPAETAAAAPLPGPPVVVRREPAPIVQPLPAPRADEIDAPAEQAPVSVRREPVVRMASREVQPPAPRDEQTAAAQLASREVTPPERSDLGAIIRSTPAAASAGDTARTEPEARPVTATPAPGPVTTLPDAARPSGEGAALATAVPQPAAGQPEPTPPGPARVGQEDTVLASIVAGITIPAEELEVVTKPPADPAPAGAEPVPVRNEPRAVAAKPAPKPKPEAVKPEPEKAKKAEPAKPDPKAAKKLDPTKPDPKAKKPDPKAKDPAKAEPRRIWVQVAGGANEESLPKAWKAAVAKAPAAFKGKSGWWTPLRATNRVLAGPFATMAEAQAFVNTIGKSGISGFVFSSEAGQKVTRLP